MKLWPATGSRNRVRSYHPAWGPSTQRTRDVAMDGTTSKTKKQNLKWAASVLKAKAGISSKMAVPKKIAQKEPCEAA